MVRRRLWQEPGEDAGPYWVNACPWLFHCLYHLRDLGGVDERSALLVLDDVKGASLRRGQHARVMKAEHCILQCLLAFNHFDIQAHDVNVMR